MTTEKTTTPATAPPTSAEATQILQQMASVGVTPGENDKATLEQHLINLGPATEVIQSASAGEMAPGLETNLAGNQAGGLTNDFGAPMTATTYSEDGRIYIYNRYTGEPVPCNVNMLASKLKNRVNDNADPNYGKLLWSVNDPGFRPKPGTYKCWLHKDGAWRELADGWNRPFCLKSNIPSSFDVIQHVRNRHTRDFEAITEHKTETERQEDRKVQQTLLEAMTVIASGNQTAATPIVTDEVPEAKEPVKAEVVVIPPVIDIWKDAHKSKDRPRGCPMEDCDWTTRAKSNKVARSVIGRHRKEKHLETLNA